MGTAKVPHAASFLVFGLLLGFATSQAGAQLVFDHNATIDYAVGEQDVHVVNGSNPPTTVTVVAPGDLEQNLLVFGSSIVNLLSGRVDEHFEVRDTGTINIRGGSVEDKVTAYDSSAIEITGGTLLDYVVARGFGQVNIHGGSLWGVEAQGDSNVFLSGGTIHAWPQETGLIAGETATIFVAGTDFNYPYGRLAGDQFGTLTGFLASGDAIKADFRITDGGSIVLVPVPEPNLACLLAVATSMLLTRCRGKINLTYPRSSKCAHSQWPAPPQRCRLSHPH